MDQKMQQRRRIRWIRA